MSQTPEAPTPGYADTVLVPVANPATAPLLLRLAATLVEPQEGRLIALFVPRRDTEADARTVEQITALIGELKQEGHPAELITHASTSVARGILDVAREENADLLVLGLRHPERGQVQLGSVVENIAAVAPCDMLIYRAARRPEFTRIVVPVEGGSHNRASCRMGILLGEAYGVPVEAIYVQESYRPQWMGWGRIEQSLAGLPGCERVRRTLVTAQNPADGLLSRIDDNDLLIVGISEASPLERWLFGDFSQKILNQAPGPVILTRRAPQERPLGSLLNRLTLRLTRAEREEILWQAQEMVSDTLDYYVLIVISALLASLGLLLNSTAVIIGAMLVAPLMQPLIGFSSGIVTGQIELAGRALVTLLEGVLLAFVIAIGIVLIVPVDLPTAEMLARTSPGVLDVGVALASGIVGAYATARKDIPAALAGVAIAAALMPPLCTVGLMLGMGIFELALQAALLFLINIACISLAALAVFAWVGLRPQLVEASRRRRGASWLVVALLAALTAAALLYAGQRESQLLAAERYLETEFAPAEIVSVSVMPGRPAQVSATIRSSERPDAAAVQEAQDELAALLKRPVDLEVTVLEVVRPPGE